MANNLSKSNLNIYASLKDLWKILPREIQSKYIKTIILIFTSGLLEALVVLGIYPLSLISLTNEFDSTKYLPSFIVNNSNGKTFLILSTVFIILAIFSFFLKIKATQKGFKTAADIGSFLSSNLLKKELSSDLITFSKRKSTEIDSIIIFGVDGIISYIIWPLNSIFQGIAFLAAISCVTLFRSSFIVYLAGFLLITIYMTISIAVKNKLKNISTKKVNLTKSFTNILNTINNNYKEIRINQQSQGLLNQFKNDDYNYRLIVSDVRGYVLYPKFTFDTFLFLFIILLLFYSKTNNFIISYLPILLTLALAIQKAVPYLQTLYSGISNIYSHLQFLHNYFYECSKHKDIKNYEDLNLYTKLPKNPVLICRNVDFKYKKNSIPILKNINFYLEPGESLCIIGKSGIGKSTLLDILLGLVNCNSGEVGILNKNINKKINYLLEGNLIKTGKFHSHMSYIPQDSFIYNKSLLFNLLPFKNKKYITEKEYKLIEKVIKMVVLDEFLEALPYGLNTIAGDSGSMISGGQKQRFILARALLREKQYLFADEPTSAMNKNLSETIIKNITEYNREKNRSLIMVSHEKVLIKYFDKILDLDNV